MKVRVIYTRPVEVEIDDKYQNLVDAWDDLAPELPESEFEACYDDAWAAVLAADPDAIYGELVTVIDENGHTIVEC